MFLEEFRFNLQRLGRTPKENGLVIAVQSSERNLTKRRLSKNCSNKYISKRKPKLFFSRKINKKQWKQHPCSYLNSKTPTCQLPESIFKSSAWPSPSSITSASILITTNTHVSLSKANERHSAKLKVRAAQTVELSRLLQHCSQLFLADWMAGLGFAAPIKILCFLRGIGNGRHLCRLPPIPCRESHILFLHTNTTRKRQWGRLRPAAVTKGFGYGL